MMPTYDFTCINCDHRWEETKPISEVDAPTFCPNCGGAGRYSWNKAPVSMWFPDSGRIYKEKLVRHDPK